MASILKKLAAKAHNYKTWQWLRAEKLKKDTEWLTLVAQMKLQEQMLTKAELTRQQQTPNTAFVKKLKKQWVIWLDGTD